MRIIRSVLEIERIIAKLKADAKSIGLVPTMGALHEGHLSLMRRARRENDILIITIFVNPTQFGPKEDYKKYPRPFSRDKRLALQAGVDYIFAPSAKQMYPDELLTSVNVTKLTSCLCGISRPGHFEGVTTVVAKLFNIVNPDRAYFGQKDYQQAIVIKKMVKDLNMNIKIILMPIIRKKDGLAISSRNTYLSPGERKAALVLSKSLQVAKKTIESNYRLQPKTIISKIKAEIKREPLTKIDYVSILDAETLKEIKNIKGKVLVALAVRIGKTRLIDNILIKR